MQKQKTKKMKTTRLRITDLFYSYYELFQILDKTYSKTKEVNKNV